MDILLYLTELLQTRKTIGIVGLGTLYKKKSPGKYDVDKHAFVPPTYTIAFTTAIKEQEELAYYIHQKRNITTDSANYYIGEFAEQIQSQLAENQEADLEPIGKLKLVNDEIILVTEQESTFGFEFYGLPTLTEIKAEQKNIELEVTIPETTETEYLEEIEEENKLEEENPGQETTDDIEENVLLNDEQETFEEIAEVENRSTPILENTFITPPVIETVEVEEKEEEEVAKNNLENTFITPPVIETVEAEEKEEEEVAKNNLENTFITPPVIETLEVEEKKEEQVFAQNEVPTAAYVEEEEPKKGMPFLIKVLIILLVIIAAGAVAYFINPTFFNKYLKNFEGNPEKNIPAVPIDSLSKKNDSLLSDSLTKTNALVNLTADTAVVDSSKVIIYEVLVSAVDTEKKANKIVANLNKQGIAAKKINLSKTMINISAGTFLAEYPAKIYRDSLRKVLKNEGIYIQPIQPKTHKK